LKIENQYIIHFNGLKEGVHDFVFTLGKPFFEAFEPLEVPDGNVEVQVELTRNTNFLELAIDLAGNIQVRCDRCLEHFGLPIAYKGHLVVRFSETDKEQDDEVIFLHPGDYRLDLKHYLYECVSVSIPIRKVHPELPNGETGCDPEMLKKLNEILIED
jgi:uncharacterized metal-binding protein YceD (DUF177 family)